MASVDKALAQGALGILGSFASNPAQLISIVTAIAGGPAGVALSPVLGLALTYGIPLVYQAVVAITTPDITEDQIKEQLAKMPEVQKMDLEKLWG